MALKTSGSEVLTTIANEPLISQITSHINHKLGVEHSVAAKNETKVGLLALPSQTEHKARRKGGRFTMILAGCSGTGKSTFLNTLFGEELVKKTPPLPNQDVRERKFELTENDFTLHLTAVDMPGFGVKMDNQYSWVPIVRYIDHHFKSHLLQEEQPDRTGLQDSRVHVCLYFISPATTNLSQLDIESMKEISKRVNLIPVISRSDTLNKEELAEFKKQVNTTMRAYGIEVCQFVSDQYVLRKIKSVAPYAVIGSNTVLRNAEGKLVRARKYHWGMVEIENPDHCDFVYLREVLLSEHMVDLVSSMEAHYNQFRLRCLQERLSRAIGTLGMSYSSPPDCELDGLLLYAIYKKAKALDTMRMIDDGPDTLVGVLEAESRKRLDESIRKEEAKFKEWKTALLERQKTYNKDLEHDYIQLKRLQREIEQLGEKPGEPIQEPSLGSDFSLNHLSSL